jgi:hypothetical protein
METMDAFTDRINIIRASVLKFVPAKYIFEKTIVQKGEVIYEN